MTPEEQRRGERLDERLAREEPEDVAADGTTEAVQLVDEGTRDTEEDLVGDLASGPGDVDDEDDLLHAMGSGADDEPAMEEAAVRVRDDAPGGSDEPSDGYVSEAPRA